MNQESESSMIGWHSCHLCRSDNYIIDLFSEGHYAYRWFKTRDEHILEQHNKTKEHIKHFERYLCVICEHQCFSKPEFEKHCDTIKHKRNSNITMDCNVCKYSTTNKQVFDNHLHSKKHINAVNGVQKEIFRCEPCEYKTKYKSELIRHEDSIRHKQTITGVQKESLYCELCDFKARSYSAMKIHKETNKHQNKLKAVEVVE